MHAKQLCHYDHYKRGGGAEGHAKLSCSMVRYNDSLTVHQYTNQRSLSAMLGSLNTDVLGAGRCTSS